MSGGRGEEGTVGALAARLLAAEKHAVTPYELARAWLCQRIEAYLPGLGALAGAPDLLPRVRGALGARLKESASAQAIAGQACPWRPPCALDVFFGRRPRVKAGRHMAELPAPYALTADAAADGALVIGLHVFGFACDWVQVMMEALAAALMRRIRWHEVAPGFRPPGRAQVKDMRLLTLGAPLPETPPVVVDIELLTGLDTQTVDILERPESFFSRLAVRTSGLARWHDCVLNVDWAALAACWRELDYEFMEVEEERLTRRRSSRQLSWYTTSGRRVLLRVRGDVAPLLPFLAMGETAHVGRKAALGMGRFVWEAGGIKR